MPIKSRSFPAGKAPRSDRPAGQALEPAAANPPARPGDLIRVAGTAAVAALFRHAPARVLRLFYEERRIPDVGPFCSQLARMRRPYRQVAGEELARIAGTPQHGGVVAVAEPQPAPWLAAARMKRLAQPGETWFVLDGVGNPHNLGAIARTLAYFGFRSLLLSDHPAQAGLSDAAYRVAEGGLDCLAVYRVSDLPAWLRAIRPDCRVIGTALDRRGVPPRALAGDTDRPRVIVLGNEETGLAAATLAACELILTLPGAGAMQSLNVAATAAILAHACAGGGPDPGKDERPARPPRPRADRIEGRPVKKRPV